MDRIAFTTGLRDLADWFDAHPDIRLPYDPSFSVYGYDTLDEAAHLARVLAPCQKDASSDLFYLIKTFGPIKLSFMFWRSTVCTKRVVRTEAVPKQVIPAHTREIAEWDCRSILAGDDA